MFGINVLERKIRVQVRLFDDEWNGYSKIKDILDSDYAQRQFA